MDIFLILCFLGGVALCAVGIKKIIARKKERQIYATAVICSFEKTQKSHTMLAPLIDEVSEGEYYIHVKTRLENGSYADMRSYFTVSGLILNHDPRFAIGTETDIVYSENRTDRFSPVKGDLFMLKQTVINIWLVAGLITMALSASFFILQMSIS